MLLFSILAFSSTCNFSAPLNRHHSSKLLSFCVNRVLAFWRFRGFVWEIGQNPKIGQLWLQRGINSISLQCITWSVACSEWGACLTDIDRLSIFRFSGFGIRTIIWIGLKSWSVRPCPDTCRHAKFYPNPCMCFWVILLTDRQTDRQTNIAQVPPRCTKCNSPSINGQCTNFILFDVHYNSLCPLKG